MKSYLHHMNLYMNKKIWLSDRCLYLMVDFLEEWLYTSLMRLLRNSIKPKVTWHLLKDHVPNLISQVIFPLLCLTQDDFDLWEEDPVEFIHRKIGKNLLTFLLIIRRV
jgi:importin-7